MNYKNIIVIIAIFVGGYLLGVKTTSHKTQTSAEFQSDTTRIVSIDTANITAPYLSKIETLEQGYIVQGYLIDSLTDLPAKVDTVKYPVYIYVDRKQLFYTDNETYDAWISGVSPQLDSIKIYNRNEAQIITNSIVETKYIKDKTKWGIGIQAGYGFSYNGAYPYIGLGISYNIYTW